MIYEILYVKVQFQNASKNMGFRNKFSKVSVIHKLKMFRLLLNIQIIINQSPFEYEPVKVKLFINFVRNIPNNDGSVAQEHFNQEICDMFKFENENEDRLYQ